MKKSKNIGLVGLLALFFIIILIPKADVEASFTQSVSLKPGWNIISTPRVIESHVFSATETSSNFDIFILNASSISGWSTMEGLGQTEFTPLYSYFINNKTGAEQSLSLTYKTGLSPNDRLFQRTFTKTGWYSIGAANPTYVKVQCGDTNDINNVGSILDSATGNYSTVIDFTDADFSTNPSSVALSDGWKAVVPSDINQLRDLRELKGYAIFITKENALFNGFQNDDSISTCQGVFMAQRNSSMSSSNLVLGQTDAKIASFVFSVSGESINVSDITLTSSSTFPFTNLKIKVDGVQFGNTKSTAASINYVFSGASPVGIPLGGSVTVDVYADVLSTATNDELSYYVKLKDASAIGVITGTAQVLKDSGGSAVSTNNISGQATTIQTNSGTITVAKDTSSPAAYQAVMGQNGKTLAIWRFNGNTVSDVNITNIVVTDVVGTAGDKASFQNLQFFKSGAALNPIVISSTAIGFSGSETGYTYVFHFASPIVIPQNSSISLELRGDVASYASGGATSNSVHTFRIEKTTDVTASAGSLPVIVSGPNNGSATDVNPITALKTKLTVTAPSASATGITTTGHSRNSNDTIAYFDFTADPANSSVINAVTMKMGGATLATLTLKLIDTSTGSAWGSTPSGGVVFGNGATSISFNPTYTLSAGATKRIGVQADTMGLIATSGSTNGSVLQMSIGNSITNALDWNDGTSSGLNLEAKVLPIYAPSIGY